MRLRLSRFALFCSVICALAALLVGRARAAGPVERLLQVMVDPADPERVVLRVGAAAEGFLFSQDGGRTFRATCSAAISSEISRLSRAGALYAPVALLDGEGRLLIRTFDAFWSDDGTGCGWTKTQLGTKLLVSAQVDPADGAVLALANTATGTGNGREAHSELMRRDASGMWTSIGLLKPLVATQRAFGGDLLAVPNGSGTRLYASVTVSVGPASAPQESFVLVSDDGGQSWRQGDVLPDDQSRLLLAAVDPLQPDRVLAVVSRYDETDQLLLSNDQGKTFSAYGEIEELSGVAFAPDGRVFIGDAGTDAGGAPGGVWTAARLGEALTRLPVDGATANPSVDCIRYDAQSSKLQVCKFDRFGLLDPESGGFEELTRLEATAALSTCPGADMLAVCEAQFNEGAAWCCSGHFPFTGFCGDYDVTQQNGMPVSCGLAGRAADLALGRGPTLLDAGAPDAGPGAGAGDGGVPLDGGEAVDGDRPEPPGDGAATSAPDAGARRKRSGGCQLTQTRPGPGGLHGLLAAACAFALAAVRKRRAREHGARQ